MENEPIHINLPPQISEMQLPGGELRFQFTKPKPNWWWRMWQYLLLGWTWRDLKH